MRAASRLDAVDKTAGLARMVERAATAAPPWHFHPVPPDVIGLARSFRYWIALPSLSGSIDLSSGLVGLRGFREPAGFGRGRLIWSNFCFPGLKNKGATRRPPRSQ
jgi:hypothetical protein